MFHRYHFHSIKYGNNEIVGKFRLKWNGEKSIKRSPSISLKGIPRKGTFSFVKFYISAIFEARVTFQIGNLQSSFSFTALYFNAGSWPPEVSVFTILGRTTATSNSENRATYSSRCRWNPLICFKVSLAVTCLQLVPWFWGIDSSNLMRVVYKGQNSLFYWLHWV